MPDIMHSLTIKSPAEKVYQALTEQKVLAGSWTPGVVAQAKVGFPLALKLGTVLKMKITKLEPGRNVTWSVTEGIPDWEYAQIIWELAPASKTSKEGFEMAVVLTCLTWGTNPKKIRLVLIGFPGMARIAGYLGNLG
jgi:uncharacterized protein YndB with AHSA1/START domain